MDRNTLLAADGEYVDGYIMVTLTVYREGAHYVSKCVELGTASCGESEEEALQNINDANLLFLNTLEQLGECAEALDRLGVAVHRDEVAFRRMTCPPNQTVVSQVIPLAAIV